MLVTDRTHLPRAALLFRLAGVRCRARSGVSSGSPLLELSIALREALALLPSVLRARATARETAVDGERVAGNHRRRRACQIKDCPGDLIGGGEPPKRGQGCDALDDAGLVEQRGGKVGAHPGWRHGVDANAGRKPIQPRAPASC